MATGMQARHRYQMSDVRQRPIGERPCVREVIHAEHRFDGIMGHGAALTIEHIPTEAMAELGRYDWPGNVRELHHVIERAVLRSSNGVLCPQVPARGLSVRGSSTVSPRHRLSNQPGTVLRMTEGCRGSRGRARTAVSPRGLQ